MTADSSSKTEAFQIFGLRLYHHLSSIKIGTDAVLLSAAIRRYSTGDHVLDVGCGCGIIGLSFLQKNPSSHLIGLDIHPPSVIQSARNALINKLSDRSSFHCLNFLNFTTETSLDLIVSNPPFFYNHLKSSDSKKNLARHADHTLPFGQLMDRVCELQARQLALILPADQKPSLISMAAYRHLTLIRSVDIYSKPESEVPIRSIVFFSRSATGHTPETLPLTIRNSDNNFTEQYRDFVYNS